VALYGELGNRFTDMAYRMRDWKSAETGFRYAFIRGLLQDGGSSTRPLAALTAQDLLSQLGTDGRSVDRARADALEQIADEVRAVEGNEHPPDVRIEIADRLLPRLDEALMIIRSGQTEQTDGTREEPR
jgi:hypothetical protein